MKHSGVPLFWNVYLPSTSSPDNSSNATFAYSDDARWTTRFV